MKYVPSYITECVLWRVYKLVSEVISESSRQPGRHLINGAFAAARKHNTELRLCNGSTGVTRGCHTFNSLCGRERASVFTATGGPRRSTPSQISLTTLYTDIYRHTTKPHHKDMQAFIKAQKAMVAPVITFCYEIQYYNILKKHHKRL